MNLLLVLRHPFVNTGILETEKQGTNMNKDSFALADTFTGRAKVEGAPRGRLDMIEERLG
jgi:hypothetical protein